MYIDGSRYIGDLTTEHGVELDVEIYGIDIDNALLFGQFSVTGHTFHSLILRTNDGGLSWYPVMDPIAVNAVINLQILEDGNGWAMLLLQTAEGHGDVTLYHTSDFGSSWHFLSIVPKTFWFGYPTLMEFSSDTEGLIHMLYIGGVPTSNRVAFLTTNDGGYTWQETGNFPLDGESSEEMDQQYDAYNQEYEGRTFRSLRAVAIDNSTANDGTQWKLEPGEDHTEFITVLRRPPQESEWEIVSILPKQYEYKDGLIYSP